MQTNTSHCIFMITFDLMNKEILYHLKTISLALGMNSSLFGTFAIHTGLLSLDLRNTLNALQWIQICTPPLIFLPLGTPHFVVFSRQ